MRQLKLFGLLSVVVFLLFGCRSLHSFSPEQIVENTLSATEKSETSYYGEMEVTVKGGAGQNIDDGTIKEWVHNGKVRNELETDVDGEVVLVSDGEVIQMYFVDKDTVIETTIDESDQYLLSPKEQLDELLVMLRETHNIETVGKETITNRSTYHLKATSKEDKNSVIADLELWIDEEYWLPLKTVVKSGGLEIKMEYTKIDFKASFDESLFVLEIPDDDSIEFINTANANQVIALEEIPEHFGCPVHVIEEKEPWEISSIHLTKLSSLEQSELLEIDYKYKGVPSIILLVSYANEEDISIDMFGELSEKVTVRKEEGFLVQSSEIVMLSWRENGLEYVLQLINPQIDISELVKLAESMITIK